MFGWAVQLSRTKAPHKFTFTQKLQIVASQNHGKKWSKRTREVVKHRCKRIL